MTPETTLEAPVSVLAEIQTLSIPDMAAMGRTAAQSLRMAQTFVITTKDDYGLAGEELSAIKGRIKRLEETRTSITGPMNKALTAINALFKGPMQTLQSAESELKGSMLAYYEEQERIAAEERRKAEAAAAAERQRIAEEARKAEEIAAAERKRIADEAAAVAAKAKEEQGRLAKEAADAAAAGNAAAAAEAQRQADAAHVQVVLAQQQAEQQAIEANTQANEASAAAQAEIAMVSAPVTNVETVRAEGASVRATVDFEVTSLLSLVQHVAKHPELINLMSYDSVKLRAYVRGLGLNTNLPGVRTFNKRSLSAKAA